MSESRTDYLTRTDGARLAMKRVEGEGPIILWVGGFRSDMEGTKALALEAAARERDWAFVRYDHFAHGQSSGEWREATVGRWCDDACALVDHLVGTTGQKVVPVGSSMGGWVALNLTLARPQAIRGLVLVNPAQDFTERLMWPDLGGRRQAEILETGETLMPDEGLGPYVLTRTMFEEARTRMMPEGTLPIRCPVHILQGRQDTSVPWRHQLSLLDGLEQADVRLDLIAQGDHRLSGPADLARMIGAVEKLTTPLVRVDGELVPASWDDALDRVASGFERARAEVAEGAHAFGMFSCSKSTNEMNYAAQKFARVVMGSNDIDSCNRT